MKSIGTAYPSICMLFSLLFLLPIFEANASPDDWKIADQRKYAYFERTGGPRECKWGIFNGTRNVYRPNPKPLMHARSKVRIKVDMGDTEYNCDDISYFKSLRKDFKTGNRIGHYDIKAHMKDGKVFCCFWDSDESKYASHKLVLDSMATETFIKRKESTTGSLFERNSSGPSGSPLSRGTTDSLRGPKLVQGIPHESFKSEVLDLGIILPLNQASKINMSTLRCEVKKKNGTASSLRLQPLESQAGFLATGDYNDGDTVCLNQIVYVPFSKKNKNTYDQLISMLDDILESNCSIEMLNLSAIEKAQKNVEETNILITQYNEQLDNVKRDAAEKSLEISGLNCTMELLPINISSIKEIIVDLSNSLVKFNKEASINNFYSTYNRFYKLKMEIEKVKNEISTKYENLKKQARTIKDCIDTSNYKHTNNLIEEKIGRLRLVSKNDNQNININKISFNLSLTYGSRMVNIFQFEKQFNKQVQVNEINFYLPEKLNNYGNEATLMVNDYNCYPKSNIYNFSLKDSGVIQLFRPSQIYYTKRAMGLLGIWDEKTNREILSGIPNTFMNKNECKFPEVFSGGPNKKSFKVSDVSGYVEGIPPGTLHFSQIGYVVQPNRFDVLMETCGSEQQSVSLEIAPKKVVWIIFTQALLNSGNKALPPEYKWAEWHNLLPNIRKELGNATKAPLLIGFSLLINKPPSPNELPIDRLHIEKNWQAMYQQGKVTAHLKEVELDLSKLYSKSVVNINDLVKVIRKKCPLPKEVIKNIDFRIGVICLPNLVQLKPEDRGGQAINFMEIKTKKIHPPSDGSTVTIENALNQRTLMSEIQKLLH